MFFKNFTRKFDYLLFCSMLIIIALGILFVFSAIHRGKIVNPLGAKQLIAVGLGLGLMAIGIGINYQIFRQYGYFFYFFSLLSLVLVLFFGKSIRGAQSWFVLGDFSFQPSEFTKIFLIFALAVYIDKNHRQINELKSIVIPFLLTLIPMGLILKQPDFGSSVVLLPIFLSMLFIGVTKFVYLFSFIFYGLITLGIPLFITYVSFHQNILSNSAILKFLTMATNNLSQGVILFLIILAVLGIIYYILINLRFPIGFKHLLITYLIIIGGFVSSCFVQKIFLKEYQKKRLLAFLDPDLDPLGVSYHIIQSKIAIGSGGIFGKGFLCGTQAQLGFLPEQHTDFIFSVIAEEWGFWGAGLVILLFFTIVWRGINIAGESKDRFGSLIATGISSVFLFYTIINIGMVMGIMPITGLPLPLFSYGGSSLVAGMFSIGLLLNIYLRRYTY